MKILVTGGAGFIGSNFVHHIINQDYEITVLDKLTYAGNLDNLKPVMSKIKFIKGDICDEKLVNEIAKDVDIIVNFAAETHVDRSIEEAGDFVQTNVFGVYKLLEVARKHDLKFMQISTDEVYGSIETGSFKESDNLNPSNPYSATKAAADLLTLSYFATYRLPILITRSTNNFGKYQHREKFIPRLITRAILNQPLPIYGDGLNVRDWIYVSDNCDAINFLIKKGKAGEVYNIAGNNEKTNIEIAKLILRELKKPESLIQFIKDRPGHDRRYSLDTTKLRNLGWKPKYDFESAMKETIKWYLNNKNWWKDLRDFDLK